MINCRFYRRSRESPCHIGLEGYADAAIPQPVSRLTDLGSSCGRIDKGCTGRVQTPEIAQRSLGLHGLCAHTVVARGSAGARRIAARVNDRQVSSGPIHATARVRKCQFRAVVPHPPGKARTKVRAGAFPSTNPVDLAYFANGSYDVIGMLIRRVNRPAKKWHKMALGGGFSSDLSATSRCTELI